MIEQLRTAELQDENNALRKRFDKVAEQNQKLLEMLSEVFSHIEDEWDHDWYLETKEFLNERGMLK